mmetsp:Transcript_57044/g.121118  ORF Transcript_57044/g.121118 Transcript_57044/m.121118 type:complete len:170 (-) Transcript_57044:257-766(-)
MDAVDGTQEKNIICDSSTIELKVDWKSYSAAHVGDSATDTLVTGRLCACGDGSSRCNCQGKVCLIEGYDQLFGWVHNCVDSGGLAAILYESNGALFTPQKGVMHPLPIPAAFIGQTDGQYLAGHSLGKVSESSLNSRHVCLPEGEYGFTFYYGSDDDLFEKEERHYNVS